MADIPITPGSGASSVATELVGARNFQLIEIYGQGGASILGINPDGSLKASIIGTVSTIITGSPSISGAVTIVGTPSISGTVNIGVIPGSTVAFQGTTPWIIGSVYGNVSGSVFAVVSGLQGASVSGTLGASIIGIPTVQTGNTSTIGVIQGSVATVIIGGSIAASFTPPANQSVSGTVQTDVRGSVAVAIISGSIAATFTPPANQSVSGTVGASIIGTVPVVQSGTFVASIVSITPSSVLVGASIFGQLPAGTAPLGSIATLQGTNPWVTINVGSIITTNVGSMIAVIQNSSILAVPVGSTVAVLQAASIVGTYAEDAASSSGDKGLFILGARNDTLSSVTNADLDYSGIAVGPMGEVISANAPITKWVYGTTSIVSGPSVAVIAAQGASIFTYVTGLQIVNPSANNLTGNLSTGAGASSVLVYWTAPANGGSNMTFPNPLRSRDNTAILASISGVGSVYLSAQGFIAKT